MRIARGTMGVTMACATSIACGVFPSLSEVERDALQATDGGPNDARRDDEIPPAPEGGASPDGNVLPELDAGPTEFTETWTGDDGTEWPASTWAFLGDQASFLVPTRQGSQGKVNPKTVVSGGAIQLFAFPNPALIPAGRTISQRIRVRGTSGAYRFALLARASGLGALGSLTGYALDCWSVDCQLGKFVAGKYTKLLAVSAFGLSETDTLLAFEVAPGERDTNVLRAKAWHASESEPAFKTYSDSDVALPTNGGVVGLRFRSTVNYGAFTIDDYVVTAKASD